MGSSAERSGGLRSKTDASPVRAVEGDHWSSDRRPGTGKAKFLAIVLASAMLLVLIPGVADGQQLGLKVAFFDCRPGFFSPNNLDILESRCASPSILPQVGAILYCVFGACGSLAADEPQVGQLLTINLELTGPSGIFFAGVHDLREDLPPLNQGGVVVNDFFGFGGTPGTRFVALTVFYLTPGLKTLHYFIGFFDSSGNFVSGVVAVQFEVFPNPPPPVPQKFLHIVAKNLHTDPNGNLVSDASSLQRLDLPAGADRLSQPFSFNLGELFKLSVVQVNPDGTDGAALPIQTSFDSQMTNPAPIRSDLFAAPTILFSKNVLIQFTSTPDQFFPIHSGTANLAVSFTPSGTSSPRTVHVPVQINSAVPFTLGRAPNRFDTLIEAFADLRGIPPQILKAQTQQESGFNSNSYRYEPLNVDFGTVSTGKSLRVDRRFEAWRLATFPDFSTPFAGLPQGSSLAAHPDLLHLRERFRVVTGASGLPVTDLFLLGNQGVSFTSLPSRNILPNDPPVSMENILFTNDQIENWIRSCDPNGCKLNPSFLTWFRARSRFSIILLLPPGFFTGQPAIAASYGLLHVLYTTAVDQIAYTDNNGVGQQPNLLFDANTGVDVGCEYLALLFAESFPNLFDQPNFPTLADLKQKFGVALEHYNRGPGALVNENRLLKYGRTILLSSDGFFPAR